MTALLTHLRKVRHWTVTLPCLNTTGYNIMADPVIGGTRTVMFVCGDDEAAKPAVLRLASDLSFDAIDAGKLVQARLPEPWAILWISLAFGGNVGREFGFTLLRRQQ